MSPITSINKAVERLEELYPFLKPVSYTEFDSMFVFQVSKADGTPIHFDNLMAVDIASGMTFTFNPLKYGTEYVEAAKKFVAL